MAVNMKTSLLKTLLGGLHVMSNNTVLARHACQWLVKGTERLVWLKLDCVHVPASLFATKEWFCTLHNPMNLKGKYRNGCIALGRISVQKRYSSTLSSTTKWDSERQNFVENENEYFHTYLKSVEEYQPYFLSFSSYCETNVLHRETATKLLQKAQKDNSKDTLLLLLSHWSGVVRKEGSSVLSSKLFNQTVRFLQKQVKLFSKEEILQSMAYLNNLGLRQTLSMDQLRKNRIIISKVYDQACAQHVDKMDVRDLLLAADFFYSVRGSSFTEFNFLMCQRMKLFLPAMTKPELILLLFHASMTRRSPANLVHTTLGHLQQHLNSLTIQELGVVNLAHYKTQSLIRHPEYFSALSSQLKKGDGLDVDSLCLAAVLKYHDKSLNRRKDQLLPQFFTTMLDIEDPLLLRITQLAPEAIVRVLNLYYSLDILSENLFMAVIDRIMHRGIQSWRLKDVAKIVHILSNIPLGSDSKAQALEFILTELQREEWQPEMDDHPNCLLQIAVSLTFCGMYPHWLVGKVFGPAAQKYFRDSKIDYSQDLYHLSQSVGIEESLYEGPLLQADRFPRTSKNKVYDKLVRVQTAGGIMESAEDDLASGMALTRRDMILLDLMDVLCQARPEISPVPTFCMSHFHTADVEILHKQESDTGEEAKSASNSLQDRADKTIVREAVVVHASNAYQTVRRCDGNTVAMLRQYHAMRARQLRALGTRVIEVPHFEFEASSDKCQYLLTRFQQEHDRLWNVGHH